ncbi:MAG TPA: response regulator transcription factor [Acidimicrobiales bacterium]|nr:response regulator transcription factor [Acidimicrobiales bacterium]
MTAAEVVPTDEGDAGGKVRILVVEDEESYREALQSGLGTEGYEVELAADGLDGLRRFAQRPPDLVLLDVLLPGMSGTEVCRRMRDIAPVPVIMVSALDTEVDIVLGLELGAADYVTKPYRLRELVARIQAVLRRVAPPPFAMPAPPAPEPAPRSDVVVAGPVRVDFARRVVAVGEHPVHFSRREFDLLALLLSPPGQVRTREELIDRLWSGRDLADTRTLDTHIRRLRVKLERDPARPQYLVTVRGVGFRFDAEGRGEPELDAP